MEPPVPAAASVDDVVVQFLGLFGCAATEQAKVRLIRDLRGALDAAAARRRRGEAPRPEAGPALLRDLVSALVRYAQPAQPEPEGGDGALPAGDPAVADRAAEVIPVFRSILTEIDAAKRLEGQESPVVAAALRQVAGWLYVFAVTHLADRPWSRPGSRRMAGELLDDLLRVSACRSVPEFLRGVHEDDQGWFAVVLRCLKPELTKETWQHKPATKHVFSWTLQQITRPWLGHHLELVLPPSLLLSDDYRLENKILGVQCLHHIIQNVPAAELYQFNRVQVIHHALFNHLYSREPQLIQAVLLSFLDLFPILEKAAQWLPHDHPFAASSDSVLQLVLTHMEAEHLVPLRRVYANNLPAFMERFGIRATSHLKRLQRVIVAYLEIVDGPEEAARLAILETLKSIIQHAWPRMACRLPVLLKALLRMMWDVTTDGSLAPDLVKAALLQRATECLLLLDHSCHGQVKVLLQGVVQSCPDDSLREYLRKVEQPACCLP